MNGAIPIGSSTSSAFFQIIYNTTSKVEQARPTLKVANLLYNTCMCGIFGYVGNKNAGKIVVEGLKRLDYRGYDSWGVAVNTHEGLHVTKDIGKVDAGTANLTLPDTKIAIGHTRWATHGSVTQNNAHPHFSTDKSFVVAQNGIVENFEELKENLKIKGYAFKTQTDTEVIVRLIEEKLKEIHDLPEAIRMAFLDLAGRNTIIILHKNGDIIAARNGSPLLVGRNKQTKEIFISSDSLSISGHAAEMLVLDNNQMIVHVGQDISLYDTKTGKQLAIHFEKMDIKKQVIDKGKYDHFMMKEIYETPQVIETIIKSQDDVEKFARAIKNARTVYTIGSGTAGGAAAQIAFYLREISEINAISLVGADASDYYQLFGKDDLIIAPSQSGETADVLEVLEVAQKKGMKIASYVNMPGSMMSRISDFAFMSHAGPEICVMSTKIYTSQIAWGYFVASVVAGKKEQAIKNLKKVSAEIKKLFEPSSIKHLQRVAKYLSKQKHIFILGKGQNFLIAKEGMIKMIEGSYIHAHAMPAGDLKHYAITLIEKGTPVIAILSKDKSYNDVLNAIHEVRARGAYVVALSPEENKGFDMHIPVPDLGEVSAIYNVVPFQLITYYMSVMLGNNVDKPRNIAKSVTVK